MDETEFEELSEILDEYNVFAFKHGQKFSKYGRASGGILIYIKKSIAQYFSYISSFTCGISLEISDKLLGSSVLYMACYLPPAGSKFYDSLNSDGVSLVELELIKLKASYPNHCMVLSGDFNARTKDSQDFIIDDSLSHLPVPDLYDADDFKIQRKSKDLHGELNEYGKMLLELCCSFGIHILNGRTSGDLNGELTCYTANVDYTIVSTSLFKRILKFEIGNEDQFTHLPQVFTIVTQILANDTDDPIVFVTEERGRERQRFNWTDASVDKLANSDKIAMFYNCMEMGDIEDGAKTLVSFLHDITELKPSRIEKDTSRSQQPWWDNELDNARAIKHKCLRFLKKENSDFARSKYRIARNRFKAMVRLKKVRYRKLLKQKLENCTSSTEFWKFIKSCKKRNQNCKCITRVEWKNYFEQLFNADIIMDQGFHAHVDEYLSEHDNDCNECRNNSRCVPEDFVNKDISLQEVEVAIDELNVQKSPGIDGVSNDILKNSKLVIAPMLCHLFNKVLEVGVYPVDWCKAIIVPVYKKGETSDPNNYRGISLLSCISKLMSKILNNRITKWAEESGKMSDIQAGFRKGKSTVDHIFVLQCLVNKYLSKEKGRFYSVFVDFSKAFDSIPHKHLF